MYAIYIYKNFFGIKFLIKFHTPSLLATGHNLTFPLYNYIIILLLSQDLVSLRMMSSEVFVL